MGWKVTSGGDVDSVFLVGLRITPPSPCCASLRKFADSKPSGLVKQPFYTWMMAILRITSIKTSTSIYNLHNFFKTEIPTFKNLMALKKLHFFYPKANGHG